MKVEGPRPGAFNTSKKTDRRKDAGGFSPLAPSGPTTDSRPAAPVSGVGSVDALLALQGVDDVAEREARAVARAGDMLDHLDAMKIALLEGRLPTSRVMTLLKTVRGRKETVNDPQLQALLDEIEVRAEVELAKLERSL